MVITFALFVLSVILFVLFDLVVLSKFNKAHACTTVIVGRRASATGTVLVGHNEDEPGRFVMQTHIVESKRRAEGSTMRFETNCAAVPLPELRARLMWAEARTLKGASFSDLYLNANGVMVCSDACTKSREDSESSVPMDLKLLDGGIAYGIRRVVAESATSAREAVDIAVKLIEKFGYAASGRSYHFADSEEAWVLQVVRGRHYAIKRVPDDEVYVIPNHYTIHEPDPDTPGLRALMDYAVERGWWDGCGQFDFARVYQAPESRGKISNMHRHVRALEILLKRDLSDWLDKPENLPFSVKPKQPVSIDMVKKILRSHFENTSSYQPKSESGTPHFAMPTRPICDSMTLASSIVELRRNPELNIWRSALGMPCLSAYLPWYFGIKSVPEDYESIDPETALATHFPGGISFDASRDKNFDWQDNIWFKINLLQGALDLLYDYNHEGHGSHKVKAARERFAIIENNIERELKMLDSQIALRQHTDPSVSCAMMQGAVNSWAVSIRTGVQSLLQSLNLFEATPMAALNVFKPVLTVQVSDPKSLSRLEKFVGSKLNAQDPELNLDLEHCLCGPRYVDTPKWSQLCNVKRDGEGLTLTFAFSKDSWISDPDLPHCLTDLMILLVNSKGERQVGFTRVQVTM